MDESKYIWGLVALLLIGAAVSYYILTGSSRKADEVENAPAEELAELQITDISIGEGKEAIAGATIKVHYTGTLEDGTVFDSSVEREPFEFVLGIGQVIQGWDQGFEGMKVGGKRQLIVPPHLGYGETEVGSIPANSTLKFEVELLEVVEAEVVE